MPAESRGPLYPELLPTLHRAPPLPAAAPLVRWFWITRWQLEPGQVSRQHLIAYPAFNLVVEPPQVGLHGPTTRASFRDLSGSGWAIGALLRPAAVRAFVSDPREVVDDTVWLSEPVLPQQLATVLAGAGAQAAAAHFSSWLIERVGEPSADALLANQLAEEAERPGLLRTSELAERLGVGVRRIERLAQAHLGVTPAALIRRRRIQEAAERLREQPAIDLARLAAETGYTDQAHLTRDFARVLGVTPGSYRRTQATAETERPIGA